MVLPSMSFPCEQKTCKVCGKPLQVYLTRERHIISVAYKTFIAVERQGYCPGHRSLSPVRSQQLAKIVAPGANIAYDVLARIGLARYLECRQSKEIRPLLYRDYGIEVKESTIRYLARKFVAYFQIVHEQNIPLLRAAMRQRGGYILHIDGTCDGASAVVLVCIDSLSGQVLKSERIGSENHIEVKSVLQKIRSEWGIPLAIVSDLRRALITAAAEVFKGVLQFVCHYHLAADVGKDILSKHQDHLRGLFRCAKVKADLQALKRSLKKYAVSKGSAKHSVQSLLALRSRNGLKSHCTPETIQGAVHGLASWILAYTRDGEGYGFPFDMPYLNLYERIVKAHRILCATITTWPTCKRGALGSILRLKAILDRVVVGEQASLFQECVSATRRDQKIFNCFRDALRICPRGGKQRRHDEGVSSTLSPKQHKDILRTLQTALNRQIRNATPSQKACEIVVQHLNKYWNYLFGHVIHKGSQTIVVPRTNNIDEALIGIIKRQCRRLHGRGHVGHDLNVMPPSMPLVQNLHNVSYCNVVYGGREMQDIAERFSQVDSKEVNQLMDSWRTEQVSSRLPRQLEGMSDFPDKIARFLSVAIMELDN